MNFSLSSIFSGLIFGGIGFVLFRAAKARANLKLIPIAISLMAYSYFVSSPILDWGIGLALCAAAYFVWE